MRADEEAVAPGKPVQNAFIESFNSKLRDECLNGYVFSSLGEARAIIEAVAARLQPPAPALEPLLPGAGEVRGKESRELGHCAHRLASQGLAGAVQGAPASDPKPDSF